MELQDSDTLFRDSLKHCCTECTRFPPTLGAARRTQCAAAAGPGREACPAPGAARSPRLLHFLRLSSAAPPRDATRTPPRRTNSVSSSNRMYGLVHTGARHSKSGVLFRAHRRCANVLRDATPLPVQNGTFDGSSVRYEPQTRRSRFAQIRAGFTSANRRRTCPRPVGF